MTGELEHVEHVVVGLGALGSATCRALAGRGHRVLGLERFPFGHSRGASHDTSRILRHSYHTPAYVRLTLEAYDDWARLEHDTGERLVTTVGGVDLFPPDPAISPVEYVDSLTQVAIDHEVLDAGEIARRWPQFRLPDGTRGLYQADAAIVPAAHGTRLMQDEARRAGAVLRDRSPVLGVRDLGDRLAVDTAEGTVTCDRLVVCADAWVDDLLAGLGVHVPVEVHLEQATYFAPEEPQRFGPDRLPLWIWMDDPSFYGFPTYGEPTVKAAQDCGGPRVDPDARPADGSDGTDERMLELLATHMREVLPGSGPPVRSIRCQYTLTPDRDFVLAPVPGRPEVVVGLGAAHGFKFAPTFGRLLADLAADGSTSVDVSPFALDRPALVDPDYQAHWLV